MATKINPHCLVLLAVCCFSKLFIRQRKRRIEMSVLFGEAKYEEARLNIAQKRKTLSSLAIYGKQNNCESIRCYTKHDSSDSHQNIGIKRIFGVGGCTKDLTLAEASLETSIKKHESVGNLFYMGRLIDVRNGTDDTWKTPSKEAFEYYLSSINTNGFMESDWEKDKRIKANKKVRSFIRGNKSIELSMVMEKVANLSEKS